MRFSRFFIDRPIFATVLSLIILTAGIMSLRVLPVSEYPEIVPPTITVTARYPGANPTVIAQTVATPLEQSLSGVENMLYTSSAAASDGTMNLTVTFKVGTNVDLAQIQVQNRVSQALPRLPEEVRALGVTTEKQSPNILMVVHLYSPDGKYDPVYMHNYAVMQVKDELARLPGAGQVVVFGAGDYAMRVWLDPARIAALNLAVGDVLHSIREQNVQVAAGVVGSQPMSSDVAYQFTVTARGRLADEQEFGNIIVKTGSNGEITRLRDVARLQLGPSIFSLRSLLNNKPAAAMAIFQAPGSNALQLADAVHGKMNELKERFPQGIEYSTVYDTTLFVRDSIREVIKTLLEATLLVALVVILFLQTWRASVIPLAAVPISIIGTFAVMQMVGFSINTLSLFGMVLAIGIVVDDAIVVVENVERHIEEGLSPREASYKAMEEVSGPIIAIALVLCAVFVPVAFISGLSGQFYRQFALTIAFSSLISAINSLTLSPALAAILLKPHGAPPDRATRWIDKTFGWLFRPFNRAFVAASHKYGTAVTKFVRKSAVPLMVYGALVVLGIIGFSKVPQGFVPAQDKQYLVAFAQLPDAASLERTDAVIRRMSDIALKQPGVQAAIAFPGLSINGFVNQPNAGAIFITLEPFDERKSDAEGSLAIVGALNQKFAAIQDAFVAVFPPPAVNGMGAVGGFKMQLEDRAGLGDSVLYAAAQSLVGRGYQTPQLAGLFSSFQINVPQIYADIDRDKVKQHGIQLGDVFQTLQVYLGSAYVNDFSKFGRTYQVIAQADAPFRASAENITQLKVRNANGDMVPLGAVLTTRASHGPDLVSHYNAYPSADINGAAAPGVSSGEAVSILEKLAAETLPNGIGFEWTDLTYQQKLAGNTAIFIFPLCVLLIFLVLAAQYESWSMPLVVVLIVPMCLVSAIAGVWITKGDNNVFTQIGLLVLVGLACKNAILIVEFARDLELQGRDYVSAALESARIRLRPILMTSFAFIMGVVPLVFATGAGAEMRHVMGIAVFSGMLGVTFFGLIFTPIFYVVVRGFMERRKKGLAKNALVVVLFAVLGVTSATKVSAQSVQKSESSQTSLKVWQSFGDTVLTNLISRAMSANTDVRVAASRLMSARASRRLSFFDLGPSVTARGSSTRQRLPLAQTPGLTAQLPEQELWDAGFDASWEIDIFGRLMRTARAQSAFASAAQHDLNDVQLIVAAEVARTYFDLRGSQRQLGVALESAENQRKTLQLVEDRLAAGSGTAFDTERARAVLNLTLATTPVLETRISADEHRLATLLGEDAGVVQRAVRATSSSASSLFVLPDTLRVGIPEQLIKRRPDVRSAERQLAASSLLLGAARTDYLPRITFGATTGYTATTFDSLGGKGTTRYVIGPVVSWPLLDLGRVKSRVDVVRAQRDEASARYSSVLLRATEETETAIVAYNRSRERLKLLDEAVRASARAADLAQQRFEAGLTDLLQVLDVQRTLLDAENQRAQGQTDAATALVVLYKAVGGVWPE